MPEIILNWQKTADSTNEVNIFEISQQHKLNINMCCPLFQGRLVKIPFQTKLLDHIKNLSAKHLQLVRSIGHQNLMSTIYGTLSK